MAKNIYTDLAAEVREMNPSLSGVTEDKHEGDGFSVSRIRIENESAAKKMEKPIGEYITLDAPELLNRPLDLFERVSKQIADEIANLMRDVEKKASVLIVGLGNRFITPDSLGPRVVEQIYVTRHILEYLPDAVEGMDLRPVSAFAPGVLGVTGVETLEVVRGIVESVKPDLIIAIDSLASRRAARISTTVQLTDTGISPGAGVGNMRKGLNKETLGIPVLAIGVPLVVFASTITQDTITLIADETGLHKDEEKLKSLAEKVISEKFGPMIVTPKDIDEIVDDMSRILADAINMAMHPMNYEDVRALIA
ncbi:MAG: Germination protease precursor [Firmicutes bacterium ADurb.Bin182]|nr:MAG: Germination protease precursor [Firmicutes bacterium ADurb.Bin182]